MDFKTTETAEATEVRLTGRLEFTDHDRLGVIAAVVQGARTQRFVIDMIDLEFIDSAGLGMLMILQEEAETRNIKMILRNLRGDVKRSIDLARLGEIIAIEA
ncbi:STAS domain-containing protein [Azospirillum sp. TSO35-2]|uniref:STAS domain-containing protein n=1 Tax=Azospirillum sp. TSO35-2 TaxID=716796 RepID=UPI000D60A317|nr:STAS domain-containing protein [Azospirillum sp. TSO35-2]PWC32652.1 anti-anti-sigma factor [Azospirillum sp. TSO35-2]